MRNYNYTAAALLGYEATMKDPSVVQHGNTTSIIKCSARDFNHSQYSSTVVTESFHSCVSFFGRAWVQQWDLVCERRVLYSTTQAVMQGGKIVAYPIFGYLIDALGRRPIVLVCVVINILAGFLVAASPTVEVYILLKLIVSATDAGTYLGIFVFVMETCATKYRAAVGCLVGIPWAIGYMITPGIAYLVRPWRLLPKSPRWLITEGRFEEALKIMTKIAKVNRKPLPSDPVVLAAMENIVKQGSREEEEDQTDREATIMSRFLAVIKQVVILLTIRQLRLRTLVVFFCWFAASMVYYGIALNATNLSTDPYLYIFLGGLLEVPSYLILWPALVYIGRKKSLVALYLIGAVCIFAVMAIMLVYPGGEQVAKVFFSQSGKVAISAAFQVVWMYTAELFPTKYRSLAVGEASFCARLGSISSPYINDILGGYTVWAPAALFGTVSLISAVLSLFLPETRHCTLPESNDLFSKKKDKEADRGGSKETSLEDVSQGVINQSYNTDSL
ncbi:Organic cation transporter protein-like 14 [Homarus americanus]|uniref:Organic cation transporter protein-like 14 n=1 Tax=Homarus americanus TaxID=6706 RepID=A0A8J5JG26_HOMAM|nr:Organic cation transporter protein-like 14 [Homarus americanus]